MRVSEIAQKLDLKVLTGEKGLDREVTGVYVCDLLSWAMSHADKGNIWITVHTHLNVVAVAVLSELSCVIIPEAVSVEGPTLEKAIQEGVAILSTGMTGYGLCCSLHSLLRD
jgi:hypothetical protein